MTRALLLFGLSAIGIGIAFVMPDLRMTLVLFVPALGVSVLMLRQARAPRMVIVDGSNVMYWLGNTPSWTPLHDTLAALHSAGVKAGVMFDANAGYLLEDRYLHDHAFAKKLGVPIEQIMVVPKGTQADGYILQAARDYNARIVTNDRFRDWAEAFPEVAAEGHMIKGQYQGTTLQLDL